MSEDKTIANGKPRKRAATNRAAGQPRLLTERIAGYFYPHYQNLVTSLQRLLRTPLQTLMMVLVIAIALALPTLLYTAAENLRLLAGGVELNGRMTIFLEHNTEDEAVAEFAARLEQRQDIMAIIFLSANSALEEFRQASGFSDVLSLLDGNPLPASILVEPAEQLLQEPDGVKPLMDWLQQQAIVDHVSADLVWLQKLYAYIHLGRQLALGLGAVLALGVLLVMGNTIRLAIANRREEIVVVKLIGGTDSYVRRPFLYTGFWYGASGGLLAWLMVWLGFLSLGIKVGELAELYQSGFVLAGPDVGVLAVLVLTGAGLGLMGAWLAVVSHLRQIQPS